MDQFPGEAVEYYSADMIEEQANPEHQYPVEFLNSLTNSNLSFKSLIKTRSSWSLSA
jgi:hypothetical protein